MFIVLVGSSNQLIGLKLLDLPNEASEIKSINHCVLVN